MRLKFNGGDIEDEFNIVRFYLNDRRSHSSIGYQFVVEWVNEEGKASPFSCHRPPAADKMLIVLMRRRFPNDDSFFRSKIQSDQIIITIRAEKVRSIRGAISKMYKLLKGATSGFRVEYAKDFPVKRN